MTTATPAQGAGPQAAPDPLREQIQELMAQARADDQMDRRGAARYPFFRPASLANDREDLGPHQAFTRELSTTGIGLLHNVPISIGPLKVAIRYGDGQVAALPAEILWCRPCGDGWYVSGGRFNLSP
jgi:hypothetical protein